MPPTCGSTENAGPENGGPKKDERTENAGLKMKDQMSGVENAGPENAGPNVMGGKCRTKTPGPENGGPTARS